MLQLKPKCLPSDTHLSRPVVQGKGPDSFKAAIL